MRINKYFSIVMGLGTICIRIPFIVGLFRMTSFRYLLEGPLIIYLVIWFLGFMAIAQKKWAVIILTIGYVGITVSIFTKGFPPFDRYWDYFYLAMGILSPLSLAIENLRKK
jgi:hypothetical protein